MQGNPVSCARVEVEQIDPAECQYRLNGENLAYLSRGKLRQLANQLDLLPDGVKLKLFKRIVFHLDKTGSPLELDGAAEDTASQSDFNSATFL